MAWIGRVCNQLRTFNIEEHIEEAFQFFEEKVAVLGQNLRVLCLDGVDDFITGLLDSEDGNIRMTEEEGIIMCDVINNSPYVLPDDKVESIKKDSDIDVKVHEDSNAGVGSDIPVIVSVSESADNLESPNESPNKEEFSVTGSSDFDSVTYSSQSDTLTVSSHCDSVAGSSHFGLGTQNVNFIEGWLMFDETKCDESCTLKHMNATVANDYSETQKEASSQLKVVLKKNDDILDAKLSVHSDEWEII